MPTETEIKSSPIEETVVNTAPDEAQSTSEQQAPPEQSTAIITAHTSEDQIAISSNSNNNNSNNMPGNNSNLEQHQAAPTLGPIRVPGTYPPEWLPDHEADSCMSCRSAFTIIKRRHHCRACGKIFCGDCCRQKAKLLYLENKEARVCTNCYCLIEYTLTNSTQVVENNTNNNSLSRLEQGPSTSSTAPHSQNQTSPKVHGVLKTNKNHQSRIVNNECNSSTSSLTTEQQQSNKQVIFADGIRPGTDLSESLPYPLPSSSNTGSSTSSASFSLLTRQNRTTSDEIQGAGGSNKKNKLHNKSCENSHKNITVCDELGYLPPIVIHEETTSAQTSNNNSLTSLIASQFRLGKKTIQASMESRSCPLNDIIKFEEISSLLGVNEIVTFLLLKDFYLKVKLVTKICCLNREYCINDKEQHESSNDTEHSKQDDDSKQQTKLDQDDDIPRYWCFSSEGLSKFGQNEIVLVIDKEKEDSCIPRDVFKIYLTLHELALRRQSLENLGNLLFQDGLFGNRDTAGLLFVQPLEEHCLKNLVLPKNKTFLFALVLQRWEVPWSKVFPMRLLLRLGHKLGVYPYPIVSFRIREPVYYEVGHTIISILGDFRNFRYSITHVNGLKVMLNKKTKKVLIQLDQSCYQQFNKVLDSSNNEHVLAWSSCPFPEADGHLVSVQNEDGQYETVEFYKKKSESNISFDDLDSGPILGASFVIFSGALKVNTSGQSAKISIVEDGLLIQIQSCTMSALRNAIHFMHHFDINCENNQDPLNRVEINWLDT